MDGVDAEVLVLLTVGSDVGVAVLDGVGVPVLVPVPEGVHVVLGEGAGVANNLRTTLAELSVKKTSPDWEIATPRGEFTAYEICVRHSTKHSRGVVRTLVGVSRKSYE